MNIIIQSSETMRYNILLFGTHLQSKHSTLFIVFLATKLKNIAHPHIQRGTNKENQHNFYVYYSLLRTHVTTYTVQTLYYYSSSTYLRVFTHALVQFTKMFLFFTAPTVCEPRKNSTAKTQERARSRYRRDGSSMA